MDHFKNLFWICYNIAFGFFFFFLICFGFLSPISSLSRDRTCTPCIGRWSLNYWTSREDSGTRFFCHTQPCSFRRWRIVRVKSEEPLGCCAPYMCGGSGVMSHVLYQRYKEVNWGTQGAVFNIYLNWFLREKQHWPCPFWLIASFLELWLKQMWEFSAFTSSSDFTKKALIGNYLGVGNEEGVLKERKKWDFRVMRVSHQSAWEPGLVGKGPGGMELNILWVSWKSLSFSCNTQRRGLWVVSYFVLKLPFYFSNFCRNKITLTGQSFVKIQVNEMEYINFKWSQCFVCLVSIKLLCFLPFKNEDSVVFCT